MQCRSPVFVPEVAGVERRPIGERDVRPSCLSARRRIRLVSGVGIGTLLATFTRSAQQALLMIFFITPPRTSLSGALTPVEAMPKWLQPLTVLNPIYHFGRITRGVLIEGSGFDAVWPNLLALAAFAAVLVSLSVWRFRRQLG